MVLIEAPYLKKFCGKVCHSSTWILSASVKEKREWEMCRNLQVSHLSLGRGNLRAQSGFTVYMNQISRTMCSFLENFFFPVSSYSPVFCWLYSQLGTIICFAYLNNVDWVTIRGCLCFARCRVSVEASVLGAECRIIKTMYSLKWPWVL